MTIAERIQLHRLGYTKEEIADLVKANYDPAGLQDEPAQPEEQTPDQEQTAPEENVSRETMTDNAQLISAIEKLTTALQASNIRSSSQPEQQPLADQLAEVYKQLTNK